MEVILLSGDFLLFRNKKGTRLPANLPFDTGLCISPYLIDKNKIVFEILNPGILSRLPKDILLVYLYIR